MEDANSHFVVLNDKIHELAKEITLRRDAEERLRSQNDLLTKQKQLLEWIAQGFELRRILEALVETVQQHTKSGTVISILLLDNEGVHLRHVVDSGLPTEYRHLIDGIAIGPSVGSCGTAAHTRKPVFVGDMLEHPLWERHREAALLSGMRACWSTPIMSQDQAVLGTFALYYPEPFPDTSDDLHIVELCTSTAAVAIQRANLEERRAATENALRRTETLAAAGRLAATVAHEINNPLAAVTNLIFLAKTNPDTPESIQELLHTADREIARVSHIAHRTVGFYRDNSSPRLVSLSKLVEEVLELYFLKFSNKGLRLQKRIQPDVGVWATEGEIRQVISNLVSNAIDACADNATINVRVTNRTSGNGVTGGKVLVADTGSGIPPYARSRVFEPFFTTKQDVGTGLGLWISKSIADKHRGSLSFRTCTTPKNQGTVFSLFIPRDAMHPNHNASPLRGQQ